LAHQGSGLETNETVLKDDPRGGFGVGETGMGRTFVATSVSLYFIRTTVQCSRNATVPLHQWRRSDTGDIDE
jgi:hypothetical protein